MFDGSIYSSFFFTVKVAHIVSRKVLLLYDIWIPLNFSSPSLLQSLATQISIMNSIMNFCQLPSEDQQNNQKSFGSYLDSDVERNISFFYFDLMSKTKCLNTNTVIKCDIVVQRILFEIIYFIVILKVISINEGKYKVPDHQTQITIYEFLHFMLYLMLVFHRRSPSHFKVYH